MNAAPDTDNPRIPFALPFIGKEEEEAALRVLRSGWLTTGQEALAFEREFADFLNLHDGNNSLPPSPAPDTGAFRALAVNSATSGLHLALESLGIGPGDLALVPSYTFTSTAEVVRYLGAEPVFVDIAPGTFHMDPRALERTLERLSAGLPAYPPRRGDTGEGFGPRGQARAVIPVHVGGLPCDMVSIMEIAGRYGLGVVEDAAHAFPARFPDGSWAGTLGDLGVFSFYATKTITTGEGGMVLTRNKALADRIAVMRSHGIDRAVWNRYTDARASWYYEVVAPGFKYNLPDILAAVGRVQLSRARDLLEKRRAIGAKYDEALGGDPALVLPPTGPGDARHLYPLGFNPEGAAGSPGAALTRDRFIEKLQNAGIGVSVHFIPLHTMPYYKKRYNLEEADFPESLRRFRMTISLPIWPGMEESQVERVITAVKTLVHGSAQDSRGASDPE